MNEPVRILNLDITTAISIVAGSEHAATQWTRGLLLLADFTYGSGGTTSTCYIQTTINGTDWIDIANFKFTTSSGNRIYNLSRRENKASIYTPTDGALTDSTSITGILGTKIRAKYVTTGTYADDTNLKIWVYPW